MQVLGKGILEVRPQSFYTWLGGEKERKLTDEDSNANPVHSIVSDVHKGDVSGHVDSKSSVLGVICRSGPRGSFLKGHIETRKRERKLEVKRGERGNKGRQKY